MASYAIRQDVPSHVPEALQFDYDVYDPGPAGSDFFVELYKLKKKAPPIFWTRFNEGHWYANDSRLVNEILRSPDRFSSAKLVVPASNNPPGHGFIPIHLDPPEHTKYRQHLSVALSVKEVHELSASVRKLAIDLIENLKPRGQCEFMAEFAFQLPIIVFMRLVDLPEEHRLGLLDEVAKIIRPGSDKGAIIKKLGEYLHPVVMARYANPKDDLISSLSQRQIDGQRISANDLLNMCTLLLIGGLDSVANTLGFFAKFYAEHPEHRRQLREDPSLVSGAIEELLRRHPTVTAGLGRVCVKDTQIGPALIKEGEQVMATSAMMNFDDEIYPDPLTVDFKRKINSVGTFGQGPHRCVGASLARSELTIFTQEWLSRIPEFELADKHVEFHAGVNIAYDKLSLRWPV